jgi:hypothetical protein
VAVKRVRGMRLVGLAKRPLVPGKAAAPSAVSQRQNAQPTSANGCDE